MNGCGTTANNSQSTDAKQTASQPLDSSKTLYLNLYFPDKQANDLFKVNKPVTIQNGDVVKSIVFELQKGDPNYGKVIPLEARLLNSKIKEDVVYLDFSKEFKSKHWGGSNSELMTMYSIVNSLTELNGIKGVIFMIEGQPQNRILGQIDTSKPLQRKVNIIKPQ